MENHTGDYDSDTHNTIRIIEDELLELKKQECDLCSRLRLLQDTIVRKRTLAQNLKNSLSPVNHLPNEILLACFRYSVQSWVDENIGTDERAVSDLVFYEWAVQNSFKLPRTPAFAISQVSHRWRQLAIDIPTFWTNLVITPIFEDHLDVFQDFLCRAKDKPITVNFRSFAPPEAPRPTGYTLMEAIMPRIDMQQIHALTFLTLGNVLPFLLSQTSPGPPSPSPITFSRLIELSIFGLCDSIEDPPTLTFSQLRQLLSATPQLKTLVLQHTAGLSVAWLTDSVVVALPALESMTIIESTPLMCKLLDSLSAPNLHELKLLAWLPDEFGRDVTSDLFIDNDDNFDLNSRLPKFPTVRNLALSSLYQSNRLNVDLISAFPHVMHLTLRSPSHFYESEEPGSPALPTFQRLQHLTLDFAFEDAFDWDTKPRFTWLPKRKDPVDRPLLISVFDCSSLSLPDTDKKLFGYYRELQQYGTFDGSSSRLDEFMRWEALANGESEVGMQS